MEAVLTRISKTSKSTLGQIVVGPLTLFTLELPDLNHDGIIHNEFRKSCIPDGHYTVERHYSKKFKECFWIRGVPGRSAILIHAGNYYFHTACCVLVGLDQVDLNNDGLIDNQSSSLAMAKLLLYDITEIRVLTI